MFYKHMPYVHWQSIETGGTGRGIPDLNGCYRGAEVWVELKVMVGRKVIIHPEQIAWIERRTRAEGRAFVAIRTPRDELILVPGRDARLILESVPRTLLWPKGYWNWNMISQTLFGHPSPAGLETPGPKAQGQPLNFRSQPP